MPSAAALAPLIVVIMGVPVMTAVVRILISSSRGAAPLGPHHECARVANALRD